MFSSLLYAVHINTHECYVLRDISCSISLSVKTGSKQGEVFIDFIRDVRISS